LPLNKHLVYTLFDEFLGALFPEMGIYSENQRSKQRTQ